MNDRIRRDACGRSYQLSCGPYTATIASVGGSLRRLRHGNRDLVASYSHDEPRPGFRGAVLAPWPNRVAGGRWEWNGAEMQLPLNEPHRGHALHGLVLWQPWEPSAVEDHSVTLTTTLWPSTGYPFALDLAVTWSLGLSGLSCTLRTTNVGGRDSPYGCSIHPYLLAAVGTVDEWTLHVPAHRLLEVDALLVPRELVTVPPERDFRWPRAVAGQRVDHAFTDIDFGADDQATVSVWDETGEGTSISFGRSTPWVQVYTGEPGSPPSHCPGVAVEPMTCPPDALRSGTDLVVLAPGESHEAWWRIARHGST